MVIEFCNLFIYIFLIVIVKIILIQLMQKTMTTKESMAGSKSFFNVHSSTGCVVLGLIILIFIHLRLIRITAKL